MEGSTNYFTMNLLGRQNEVIQIHKTQHSYVELLQLKKLRQSP